MDDSILNDVVNSEDLKKSEEAYNHECRTGKLTRDTKFSYAWCLIRSKYPADVRKGIQLFEIMYNEDSSEEGKRSSLYFMALGHARVKDYCKSLRLIESFLSVEPGNKQLKDLETVVRSKMKKEGLEGLAVAGALVGGGALVLGGLVGLGLAMSKKKS